MRSLAGLVALLTLSSACSYAYVDRYHEPPTTTSDIYCSSSYQWPVVDAVLTALATAATVYAGVSADDSGDAPGAAGLVGFGSLAALGYGTSAIYGAYQVSTCRAEKQRAE